MHRKINILFLAALFLILPVSLEAYQHVRMNSEDQRLLEVDYDKDGVYEPFLVKGIGYTIVPIGFFHSPYGLCRYYLEEDMSLCGTALLYRDHGEEVAAQTCFEGIVDDPLHLWQDLSTPRVVDDVTIQYIDEDGGTTGAFHWVMNVEEPEPWTRLILDERYQNDKEAVFRALIDCDNLSQYELPGIMEPDLPRIKDLNINVLRTFGGPNEDVLRLANEHGLKVSVGFYLPHYQLFGEEEFRQDMKEQYRTYVQKLVDFQTEQDIDAILTWEISNENNLNFCREYDHENPDQGKEIEGCEVNEEARLFYSLVNEMAGIAKTIENENEENSAHPVQMVSAELGYIGDASFGADDASLPNIDIHGVNSYRVPDFGPDVYCCLGGELEFAVSREEWWRGLSCNNGTVCEGDACCGEDGCCGRTECLQRNLFDQFECRSDKAIRVTEFGVDAWDRNSNAERQDIQMENFITTWNDIAAHSVLTGGPAIGADYFVYSDDYWQNGAGWDESTLVHDTGCDWPGGPDRCDNQEWHGIMARLPYTEDPPSDDCFCLPQYDCLCPRMIADELRQTWQPFKRGDVNADGKHDIADAVSILNFLFIGGKAPSCLDAADVNDEGAIDISDAVQILRALFFGNATIPEPYLQSGIDLTPDDLRCHSYPPE